MQTAVPSGLPLALTQVFTGDSSKQLHAVQTQVRLVTREPKTE